MAPTPPTELAPPPSAALDGTDGLATFCARALALLQADALCLVSADGEEEPAHWSGDETERLALLDDRSWTALPTIGALATIEKETSVEIDAIGRIRLTRSLYTGADRVAAVKIVWPPSSQIDERIDRTVSVLAQMAKALYWDHRSSWSDRAEVEPSLAIASVLSELALTARSYEELVGGVAAATCTLVGAAKGGVAILREHGSYLQLLPGSFGVSPEFAASSRAEPSNPQSPAGRVTREQRTWFTNDVHHQELSWIRDFLEGFGAETYLIAPLVVGGRAIGVTHLANKPGGFDDDDVRLLETITTFVAAAVEHVSRRLRLKRNETIASVLGQTATAIAGGDPSPGFTSLLSEFCRAVDARVLAVSFTDESPQIVIRRDNPPLGVERFFLEVSARGVPAIRSDSRGPVGAGDPGWDAIHAPVLVGGSHEGTVSILRLPSEPFTDEERQSVRRLANLVALAWATERYQQERAQMARLRERQRIADDLHDHVAQILFSAQLALETVLQEVGDQALSVTVERARDLLGRSEVGIREVIHRLSSPPPDDLGSRLMSMTQTVEEDFAVPIHLEVPHELESVELTGAIADTVVGAAREALINAAKHAGKCRISLSCAVGSDRLQVRIVDDGLGQLSRPLGYGLQAHRRRIQGHGGVIRIERPPGRGTRVLISVPLDRGAGPEAPAAD